jgi:hypothetical protein
MGNGGMRPRPVFTVTPFIKGDRICRPQSLLLTGVRRVLRFSAQVHKIDKIDLHGIRLRRTGGDIWLYKTLCTRLMEQMKL